VPRPAEAARQTIRIGPDDVRGPIHQRVSAARWNVVEVDTSIGE
jgi:hypothetical protein